MRSEFWEYRNRLDRSYHKEYLPERQALQDSILRTLLGRSPSPNPPEDYPPNRETDHHRDGGNDASNGNGNRSRPRNESPGDERSETNHHQNNHAPWIVFTAGVYGAGKSHTIRDLQSRGCFPSGTSFVGVDPDEIRGLLPEFASYEPREAGIQTQKEAGMIAELLTDAALSEGRNVVVDGSLRDAAWHEQYFATLRGRFGGGNDDDTVRGGTASSRGRRRLLIGILYVTAPAEDIYDRVEKRGIATGRPVPPDRLERSMREVPNAIERLRPLADLFLHVHNDGKSDNSNNDDDGGRRESFYDTTASAEPAPRSPFPSNRRHPGTTSGSAAAASATAATTSGFESMVFQEKCRSVVGY